MLKRRGRPGSRAAEQRLALADLFPDRIRPGALFFLHDAAQAAAAAGPGAIGAAGCCKIENIAVFAPIPSARDRMATAETIGVARSARKASRRSGMKLPRRLNELVWAVRRGGPRLRWQGPDQQSRRKTVGGRQSLVMLHLVAVSTVAVDSRVGGRQSVRAMRSKKRLRPERGAETPSSERIGGAPGI